MPPISRSSWYPLILLALDAVATAVSLWVAYFLRFGAGLVPPGGDWDPQVYLLAWPFVVVLLVVCFSFMRLYDYGMKTFDLEIFHRITNAAFIATVLFVLAEFFLRSASYSRALTLLSFVCVVAGVSIGRYHLDLYLTHRKLAGLDIRRVAIIGLRGHRGGGRRQPGVRPHRPLAHRRLRPAPERGRPHLAHAGGGRGPAGLAGGLPRPAAAGRRPALHHLRVPRGGPASPAPAPGPGGRPAACAAAPAAAPAAAGRSVTRPKTPPAPLPQDPGRVRVATPGTDGGIDAPVP